MINIILIILIIMIVVVINIIINIIINNIIFMIVVIIAIIMIVIVSNKNHIRVERKRGCGAKMTFIPITKNKKTEQSRAGHGRSRGGTR